ncbi:MAG: polysaccharide lyase [Fusobacteriaceae bacterium]
MKKKVLLIYLVIFGSVFSKTIWEPKITKAWKETWKVMPDKTFGTKENLSIENENGELFFRVKYPKGSVSSNYSKKFEKPLGGAQFYTDMGIEGKEKLELTYDIRFSDNFNFVKGGKLPGFYGGDRNASGKRIPTEDSGFSTRYMWRREGKGVVYAYLPTSEMHGTDLGSWQFEKGKWHKLTQIVKLNTPSKKDGAIEVFLDGKKVAMIENLSFRVSGKLKIEGLFFSTFFGGSDETWASTDDVFVDFKNFIVSE